MCGKVFREPPVPPAIHLAPRAPHSSAWWQTPPDRESFSRSCSPTSTNVPWGAYYDANKRPHERQAWIGPAQICFELRLKSITVQFDFFGECFLYDSPLFVVERFLIGPPVAAIFRFGCHNKGPVKLK